LIPSAWYWTKYAGTAFTLAMLTLVAFHLVRALTRGLPAVRNAGFCVAALVLGIWFTTIEVSFRIRWRQPANGNRRKFVMVTSATA